MKRFITFIGVGSFFSTVEEFLTVVVLKHDVASYVITLLVLFPMFLTFVYFSSMLLDMLWHTDTGAELSHFFVYGWVGLMMEWFLMGHSPWGNPAANPVLMLGFQLGMFSFWSTVAFAPRLFLADNDRAKNVRRWILAFYVPYFVFVYVIGLAVPADSRFGTIVILVIAGYFIVSALFACYFVWSIRSSTLIDKHIAIEGR
jgi:hypothetical protein